MGAYVKTDWGNVIPTWHISAASAAIHDLGPQIDIVVSSMDFLFPHLENVREIGEALTGKPFANIWMIAERVWSAKKGKGTDRVDESKPVRELFEMGYSAREVRYWLLSTHYRKPIQATSDNISNTVRGLRRIDEFIVKVRACGGAVGDNNQLSEMSQHSRSGISRFACRRPERSARSCRHIPLHSPGKPDNRSNRGEQFAESCRPWKYSTELTPFWVFST